MKVSARALDMGNNDDYPQRGPVVRYEARPTIARPALARSRQRAQEQREEYDARRKELLQRMGKKDTRQSLADLEAAYRGTNASEGTEEFDIAFAKDANGNPQGNKPEAWQRRFEKKRQSAAQVAGNETGGRATGEADGNPQAAPKPQGAQTSQTPQAPKASPAAQTSPEMPTPRTSSMVSNPPPATNFRPGDSGRNSLADVRTVTYTPPPTFRRDKNGVPVESPEQIARANKAWLDSGMGKHVVGTTEKPRVRPDAELNSRKIQALLDANVNPGAQLEVARAQATPGNSVGTQYGNISVRDGAGDAKDANGKPLVEAVPIPNGLARDKATVWQNELMKKYPEIGQRDSEANRRFVAAWKEARSGQGPNLDGSAGADPMKIAHGVTQDLARQREEGRKLAAQQEEVTKAYPEIGQQGSEANKRYAEGWKDGAWQGPNLDGAAGADPMKIAREVTRNLAKEGEAWHQRQTQNFFSNEPKIPMANSTLPIGSKVTATPATPTEMKPFGTDGLSYAQPKEVVPPLKLKGLDIGAKPPEESAFVKLGEASIGTSPLAQLKIPSEANRPESGIAGVNPSPLAAPNVDIPGVPALPKPPIGPTSFFGPSGSIDVSIPDEKSKVDPTKITWGGMGEKAGLTAKDKPDDDEPSQDIANP